MEKRALIELLDRHDDVIARFRIGAEPLSIGRALDCDIVLDDPYTAPTHGHLHLTAEGWTLALGDSLNGAWHDGLQLPASSQHKLPPSSELEFGQTRLRLRHPQEVLAPEIPLPKEAHLRQSWKRFLPSPTALLLVALVTLWQMGSVWVESPPDAPWSGYFDELLATMGAALAWSGLWSLLSQLFRRDMPFWKHLQAGLIAYLVVRVAGQALGWLAYSVSMPALAHLTSWVTTMGAFLAAWFCAKRIWPKRKNRVALTLAVLMLLVIVPQTIKLHADQHRWLQPLYMTTLAPPSLRLAQPVNSQTFLQGLSTLEPALIKAAKQDAAQDDGEEDANE